MTKDDECNQDEDAISHLSEQHSRVQS